MTSPGTEVDRRKHPRAQLHLPARIRWQGPLGMRLEVVETADVAREGLLLHRTEACQAPSRVWIVFPYDRDAGAPVQPETPARIVRVARDDNGGYWIAVRFEPPARETPRAAGQERRRSARFPFALPIFVRIDRTPWPEESMTRDLSQNGVRFETSHVYAIGDTILARIPWGEWSSAGEVSGQVLRVDNIQAPPDPAPLADLTNKISAILTLVAVEWTRKSPS